MLFQLWDGESHVHVQWRNRWGEGAEFPQTFFTENFLLTYREKWAKEERKNGERKEGKFEREEVKRWKNLKWKGKRYEKWVEDFFFFFFLLACFSLSLFETTKICLGSTKMVSFYRQISYFTPGKNRENWLCPLWKIFLLRPCAC